MNKEKVVDKIGSQLLKDDIRKLESQVKSTSQINIKNGIIRNLKISGKLLTRVAPYVVVAGIMFGIGTCCERTPFYLSDKKEYLHTKTRYSSHGVISTEQQYGSFGEDKYSIYHYSEWRQNENGQYVRTITKYSINNISDEYIEQILENNSINLENMFGKPDCICNETRNFINEIELQEGAHISVIVYDENKDDYIVVKESIEENEEDTSGYVASTVLCMLFLYFTMYVCVYSENKFSDFLKQMKEKYPNTHIKELKQELKIKRKQLKHI